MLFRDISSIYYTYFFVLTGRYQRSIGIGTNGFQSNTEKSEADLQPQFDVYHRVENHTIQLGATAFLPCIIKNLGNRSVCKYQF